MAKIKRNDPCPCGSGKKYKQCHEPIDRARDDHNRLLRRAADRLLPKLIETAQQPDHVGLVASGLERFWDGQYTIDQLEELDDLEEHGAERFLTWLVFDWPTEDGRTLVEQIAAETPADMELDDYERELLGTWTGTRLRPYLVTEILAGKGARVRDLLSDAEFVLRDHAAAKRIEEQEVLFGHLVPVADEHMIAGTAANSTPDTREKLDEYLAIYREQWLLANPGADNEAFVGAESARFNHFVQALPREESASKLDDLLLKGRTSLTMARDSLGFGPAATNDADAEEPDADDDNDNNGETATAATDTDDEASDAAPTNS